MLNIKFAAEADFMKSISHPTRLQIMELLRSGEKCVCDIHSTLNLEQSNVSRHLAVMKREGLIQSRKEGLKVIYWAPDSRVYEIIDLCSEIIRNIWLKKAELVK